MGKFFWPIYIAVASVSGALVWRFSPALGRCLPPQVCHYICNVVDSTAACFTGGDDGKHAPPDTAAQEPDCPDTVAQARVSPDSGLDKRDTPRETAPDPNRPPARRGVFPVDSIHASWGVLTRTTPVEDLDGTVVARLSGGRFFKVEKTISTPSGPMIVGKFLPQKRPGNVRIPLGNLNCLTGAPSYLSTNQQTCLRMYYQLTDEAERLKGKLMAKAARKSPYQQAAADALNELEAKEKSVKKLKTADFDTRRKVTYEISQLREKLASLNQKHKDWKAEHAAELPDPEKDPVYLEILRRRESYVAPIQDLLF